MSERVLANEWICFEETIHRALRQRKGDLMENALYA